MQLFSVLVLAITNSRFPVRVTVISCFGRALRIYQCTLDITKEQLEKFEKDGILIIENFLSPEDVSSIRAEYCCNIL